MGFLYLWSKNHHQSHEGITFLIFHVWVVTSFAQQYLFGDFQRRYQLEKALFK